MGLSPRVRGNPNDVTRMRDAAGSIPACAGEPGCLPRLWESERVYPRVCGGTERARAFYVVVNGLSPRVRGNPSRSSTQKFEVGSIPACAGEPPGLP